MKSSFLTLLLTTVAVFTSVSSMAQSKQSPTAQQIQTELQLTRLNLQNALMSLKNNPKLSAENIQTALLRINSVSNATPQIMTGYYVTLKSKSGALFSGEAPTLLRATVNAQKDCFENINDAYCDIRKDSLTVSRLVPGSKVAYCTLKSKSGALFGAEGRLKAEATLKAQQACFKALSDYYCDISPENVVCE